MAAISRTSPPNHYPRFANLSSLAIILLVLLLSVFVVQEANKIREVVPALDRGLTTSPKWVPKSKARICRDDEKVEELKYNFQGQSQEDIELMTTYKFDNLCEGTYLEMGGFTGIRFSNSFVFNNEKKWNGVLVEASPSNYASMIQNRPNELASINAALCNSPKDLHWVTPSHGGAVSGFNEFAAQSFKDEFWTEEEIKNAQVVKCRTLTDVLDEAVGEHFHFDFYSLDTEGAELDILLSLDFSRWSFGILFVESDTNNFLKDISIRWLLEKNGYKFVKNAKRSDWYMNENFGEIYKDLLIYPPAVEESS